MNFFLKHPERFFHNFSRKVEKTSDFPELPFEIVLK